MTAILSLAPVFFMIAFGIAARKLRWMTADQIAGVKRLIFNILFPVMLVQLLATATLSSSHILVVGYVFACLLINHFIARLLTRWTGSEYAHFSPFLLAVVEGGVCATPLYLSIVGPSSNMIIIDIAGMIMCFVVLPILVAKKTSESASVKAIAANVYHSLYVRMVVLGLFLNVTGIYAKVMASAVGPVLDAILSQITVPIVPVILFILGFDFDIDKSFLKPLAKMAAAKTVLFAFSIAGFFLLFPQRVADPAYRIAPILYFSCPTGLGVIPIITPLFRSKRDNAFVSAFISGYMIITMIVFAALSVWYTL